MKIEGFLFVLGTFFFSALALAYWIVAQEAVGTTGLVLTAGLSFLIGFYVLFTGRRVGVRPEDDFGAEVADGAGEYGHFAPQSVWPLPLGISAAAVALGLVVGWWLMFLAVIALMISIIGLVFENYRGEAVDR